MTDAEVIRACAVAMEDPPTLPGTSDIWGYVTSYSKGEKSGHAWVLGSYNPLTNNDQAMKLVKRFGISIRQCLFTGNLPSGNTFYQWEAKLDRDPRPATSDLNRQICLCVADMRKK